MEIFVSQISDYLNQDREQRQDQYTNKAIGKLVSVLGFEKKHKTKGTVIIWNDETVERLKNQYGITEDENMLYDGMTKKSPKLEGADSIFAKE